MNACFRYAPVLRTEARFVSDGRIGVVQDARLERWNSNEELAALVSFELRIHGAGVSLHCEVQTGYFF